MRGDISWSSRRTACSHTLLVIHLAHQNMLSGINLQNLSRTVTHRLSSRFSLQQYNYTRCRSQEHSLRRERTAQHNTVLFPLLHMWWRDWKSTDTRRDTDLFLQTFVRWCYMFAHASVPGSDTKEEKVSGSELHGAGQDLGHSQDFLMESGCSLTHDKNISSNHY